MFWPAQAGRILPGPRDDHADPAVNRIREYPLRHFWPQAIRAARMTQQGSKPAPLGAPVRGRRFEQAS